jgi:GDP-L-fucose synthase
MIRKFHEAKENQNKDVVLWGSGSPKREFLYVDDLADACLFLMEKYNPSKKENEKGEIFLNIGTGEDLSIKELASIIKKVVGYKGKIIWDESKPDGTPRKLLDVSKIHNLGWKHKIDLETGIRKTYEWYKSNSKIQ